MTSANHSESATDGIGEQRLPHKTVEELPAATITFQQTPITGVTPNSIVSPELFPVAGSDTIHPRRHRRIVQFGTLICGLGLVCAAIVLMNHSEKEPTTIETPAIVNHNVVQGLQLREPPPQKVDVTPVDFLEPPDLEDWLKGRTIRTVAQDGSGEFNSIQSALNALQAGQVVEVLDAGPYRERLALIAPPADIGLISRVRTCIEFADTDLVTNGNMFHGHDFNGLNHFRIYGFEFVIPDNPQGGKRDVASIHFWNSKGVVFENCAVHRTGANSFLIFGNHDQAAIPPNVIRECDLEVNLQGYSHQSDSEIVILRNHLSVSLTLISLYRMCVVRNNVFLNAQFVSHVMNSDAYECSNNTFVGRQPSIHMNTRLMVNDYETGQFWLGGGQGSPPVIERGRAPTGHGVIFNNLHSDVGFFDVSGGGERDPWTWDIGFNCYPADESVPAESTLSRPTNTLATPVLYPSSRAIQILPD